MKITQYEHPSQGIVQRAPQSLQQPAALPPPPPFRPSQQQPIHPVKQPAYIPPQRFTQLPVNTPLAPPPFNAAPPPAQAVHAVQPSPPTFKPHDVSPVAAPVVSMDTIPAHVACHACVYSVAFSCARLTSYAADVQQPSSAGAAVSIKPPPRAAKGPAKQVTEKTATEYAKLEDQMFEL